MCITGKSQTDKYINRKSKNTSSSTKTDDSARGAGVGGTKCAEKKEKNKKSNCNFLNKEHNRMNCFF